MKLLLTSIAVIITSFSCVIAQRNYLSDSVSYQLKFGGNSGIIVPRSSNLQFGNIYGIIFGVQSQRFFLKGWFTCGIDLNYQVIDGYKNQVVYTSNWVNGPENIKVNLNTNMWQVLIRSPFTFGYYIRPKLGLSVGFEPTFLLNSKIKQEAIGNYSIEKYPSKTDYITALVKYANNIDLENNKAGVRTFNLSPILNISYPLHKNIKISYQIGYELFSNAQIDDRYENYYIINNQIQLLFKLNNYENNN